MNSFLSFLYTIQWQQPWWFLLALQPLLLWLVLRWFAKKSQQNFADEHLLPWVQVQTHKTVWQKIFSRNTAYFLAWIGFSLALANPQLPDKNAFDPNNTDLDVMLVIDLSRSMHATDIKPSRLRRATLEAYEFLSLIKSAKVGIVVYAARAHLYVPLTNDFNAIAFYLKNLDSLQLPTLGSDPASALLLAQKELMKTTSNNRNIVWLTDGDLDENQLDGANQVAQDGYAKRNNTNSIKSTIFGMASHEGAVIPLADGSWLEVDGQAVISKPKFDDLHKTAKKGGGVLSLVESDESDWNKIFQEVFFTKQNAISGSSNSGVNKQLKTIYQWFLFPALICLFMALFFRSRPSLKGISVLIALFSIIAFSSVKADETFLSHTNQGVKAYANKEFSMAKSQFTQAVLTAKSDKQRAIALHNLGNSLFQKGDYENATKLFTDALRHNPEQIQSINNQQLSNELFKVLEIRKRKAMMRGNLSAPNQNSLLFNLPKNINSTLSTKAINTTKLKLPELPKADLDRLLNNGFAFLQLLQIQGDQNPQQKKARQDVESARQLLIELGEKGSVSSNTLWKRLFEIEEGFAGSLKKPEKIPGVKPW